METIIKEKRCGNCRHYVRHYMRVNGEFIKLCCGHCGNPDMLTDKTSDSEYCDLWQPETADNSPKLQ